MRRLLVVLVLGRCGRLDGGRARDAEPGAIVEHPVDRCAAGRLAFNTGLTAQPNGLTWDGKQYAADQLPEFLARLRGAGVTNLGEWLNLHPAVSAKFGMMPVGLLHSPEVVTQQAKFAPGARLGLAQPSRLPDRRRSSRARSSATAPTARRRRSRPASRSTRPRASTFIVKNESTTDPAVVMRDVRRPRRHADHGAPRRQAAAQRAARK